MMRAVVSDVGECLVDETREYGTWADWLGVPRHMFAAMFGAVIARGQDYRQVFQEFQPGFDLYAQSARSAPTRAGRSTLTRAICTRTCDPRSPLCAPVGCGSGSPETRPPVPAVFSASCSRRTST
jgi:hypothetical protein